MNFIEFWGHFFESVKKKIEEAGSNHKSDEERELEMEKYFKEQDEKEKQYREWFRSLTKKQKTTAHKQKNSQGLFLDAYFNNFLLFVF